MRRGQYGGTFEYMVDVVIMEKVPVVSVTGGNSKGVLVQVDGYDIRRFRLGINHLQEITWSMK